MPSLFRPRLVLTGPENKKARNQRSNISTARNASTLRLRVRRRTKRKQARARRRVNLATGKIRADSALSRPHPRAKFYARARARHPPRAANRARARYPRATLARGYARRPTEMCPGLETPPADGVVWSRDDVLERGHRRLEHEPRSRVATATLAGLEVAKQDPPISQPRSPVSQVDAALASRNAGSAGPPSESRRGEASGRGRVATCVASWARDLWPRRGRAAHGLGRVGPRWLGPWSDGVAG